MLCALSAFFIWVVVDAGIKLGGEAALSPFMIMAILGGAGAVGTFASAFQKRDLKLLRPTRPREQALICLCSLVINYANPIALKHLPLTIFYIVVFSAPLAIAVLVALLKHEKLTGVKVACLAAGFVGVVIAVGLRGGSGEWIGIVAALAATMGFAFYTIIIQKIAKTVASESILFANFMTIFLAGVAGAFLQAIAVPGVKPVALMIVAGIVNMAGNALYNKALHGTSSTNVAQLHYTQIISGALLGYLIWHEIPTWNLWLGSVLIVASGIVVAAQLSKPAPAPS